MLRTRASSKCIDLQAESSSAPSSLATHPRGPLMGLITAFYAVFSGPRGMRNGLEMRNGVGGERHARYGYPRLLWPGLSKFRVSDRTALGLCITTCLRLPDGTEKRAADALCELPFSIDCVLMSPLSLTCRRIAVAKIRGNVSMVDMYVIYDLDLRSIRFLRFKSRIGRGGTGYYRR
jgi:hypothetical protein